MVANLDFDISLRSMSAYSDSCTAVVSSIVEAVVENGSNDKVFEKTVLYVVIAVG